MRKVLFCSTLSVLLFTFSACDSVVQPEASQEDLVTPSARFDPSAPFEQEIRTAGSGDDPCPKEVDPADCVPIADQKWEQMRRDIDMMLNTDDPDCRAARDNLQQFYESGRMYTYPDFDDGRNRITLGWWVLSGGRETISFNDQLWSTWSWRRPRTAMHEGYHARRNGGSEQAAEAFQSRCVEW